MNEWNLIGNDWAVHQLARQVVTGQLAQSNLIVGPQSIGKTTLAIALAQAVLSQDTRDPQRARLLIDNHRHPDLTWIEQKDKGFDRAEALRDLLHTLSLTPVEGARRVAILQDAHIIIERNSIILKTLEEPNPSSVIILVAPRIESVLPTIASRCQIVSLRPVARRVIAESLVHRGVEGAHADLLARLAHGCPGWAIRASDGNELLDMRAQHLQDLEQLLTANRTRRFEFAEALARSDDDVVVKVLTEWLFYWRDIVRAGSSQRLQDELRNIDHHEMIVQISKRMDIPAATQMVRAIATALQYLGQNANPRLVLDALLLQMPVL